MEGAPGHQLANCIQLGAQKILGWLGEKVQIFQNNIYKNIAKLTFLYIPTYFMPF